MKFEDWKYWLDVNIHIKEAIGFSALALAISSLAKDFPFSWMIGLGIASIVLLGLLSIFQLILGIWQISISAKKHKEKKEKELLQKEDQEDVPQAKV